MVPTSGDGERAARDVVNLLAMTGCYAAKSALLRHLWQHGRRQTSETMRVACLVLAQPLRTVCKTVFQSVFSSTKL